MDRPRLSNGPVKTGGGSVATASPPRPAFPPDRHRGPRMPLPRTTDRRRVAGYRWPKVLGR